MTLADPKPPDPLATADTPAVPDFSAQHRGRVLRIVAIYALVASLWIIFSDRAVEQCPPHTAVGSHAGSGVGDTAMEHSGAAVVERVYTVEFG